MALNGADRGDRLWRDFAVDVRAVDISEPRRHTARPPSAVALDLVLEGSFTGQDDKGRPLDRSLQFEPDRHPRLADASGQAIDHPAECLAVDQRQFVEPQHGAIGLPGQQLIEFAVKFAGPQQPAGSQPRASPRRHRELLGERLAAGRRSGKIDPQVSAAQLYIEPTKPPAAPRVQCGQFGAVSAASIRPASLRVRASLPGDLARDATSADNSIGYSLQQFLSFRGYEAAGLPAGHRRSVKHRGRCGFLEDSTMVISPPIGDALCRHPLAIDLAGADGSQLAALEIEARGGAFVIGYQDTHAIRVVAIHQPQPDRTSREGRAYRDPNLAPFPGVLILFQTETFVAPDLARFARAVFVFLCQPLRQWIGGTDARDCIACCAALLELGDLFCGRHDRLGRKDRGAYTGNTFGQQQVESLVAPRLVLPATGLALSWATVLAAFALLALGAGYSMWRPARGLPDLVAVSGDRHGPPRHQRLDADCGDSRQHDDLVLGDLLGEGVGDPAAVSIPSAAIPCGATSGPTQHPAGWGPSCPGRLGVARLLLGACLARPCLPSASQIDAVRMPAIGRDGLEYGTGYKPTRCGFFSPVGAS